MTFVEAFPSTLGSVAVVLVTQNLSNRLVLFSGSVL